MLPTTIPQRTRVDVGPSGDRWFHLVSATLDQRVRCAAGDAPPPGFGRYVFGCIEVLRDDFRVSPPALDLLARTLQEQPGIHGARLTGAGFGGACVALAVDDAAAAAASEQAFAALMRGGFKGSRLI